VYKSIRIYFYDCKSNVRPLPLEGDGHIVLSPAGLRTRRHSLEASYSSPLPNANAPVLQCEFRFCLPLRGSPGFTPGSLLRLRPQASATSNNRDVKKSPWFWKEKTSTLWLCVIYDLLAPFYIICLFKTFNNRTI